MSSLGYFKTEQAGSSIGDAEIYIDPEAKRRQEEIGLRIIRVL